MSGQRRANWRTEAAALVASESELRIAERELFRQRLTSIEASLLRRIQKLERDRTLCVWAIAALILAVGLLAVTK